jgi:hypothetical protein
METTIKEILIKTIEEIHYKNFEFVGIHPVISEREYKNEKFIKCNTIDFYLFKKDIDTRFVLIVTNGNIKNDNAINREYQKYFNNYTLIN